MFTIFNLPLKQQTPPSHQHRPPKLSTMADFDAVENPHYLFQNKSFPLQAKPTSRTIRGKFFCSNFLFRLVFIALFLSFLPLFSSEAPPDFISHTVFAKSWELVHLFIIGILVSYGLFGRWRTQTHSRIQTSLAFNSPNILHASTIFNFEHQNPSGYSVYYGNVSVNENGNQAWDFRPYGLEPTVVVRPGTCDFDYQPLDLPVRSLRSMVEESDSEEYPPSESEVEADGSSSCCSEEDNESLSMEETNVVGPSPIPWNWPSSAHNSCLSSPSVNHEAKQASFETFGVSLSAQASPLCSSKSESQSMDVEVESSWGGPTREEDVLVSQTMPSELRPMMKDPKEEMGDVCFAREFHEVRHVKTRSFRVSSSNGSSPLSPSLSESPPMEVGSSVMEKTSVDTKLFPSPSTSLKSRSLRVDFKEKVGNVSLNVDTQCQNQPHSQSPVSNFSQPSLSEISSAVSESSPTIEKGNLQKESKKVDSSWKETSEDHHIPSSFDQVNGFPLKRVGSRGRRPRKRDDFRKGGVNSRTDSLRSESSSDTTTSTSPPTSTPDFTSTADRKQSPDDSGISKDKEINAFKNDFVLSPEASRIQLGASSSLSKDVAQSPESSEHERKTLSRTSNARRFSTGSFFDRDMWKGSKEITKKGKDDTGSKSSSKCGWDCLKLDLKPTLTKSSSLRGKSVRTVRPQAITLEPSSTNEVSSKQKSDERQDIVIISIGISEKRNDRNQKDTKQERGESFSPELGKNKEKSIVVEDVNEDEDCNSEIDRKADEFIAKFKEQIRQQKAPSRRVSSKH